MPDAGPSPADSESVICTVRQHCCPRPHRQMFSNQNVDLRVKRLGERRFRVGFARLESEVSYPTRRQGWQRLHRVPRAAVSHALQPCYSLQSTSIASNPSLRVPRPRRPRGPSPPAWRPGTGGPGRARGGGITLATITREVSVGHRRGGPSVRPCRPPAAGGPARPSR